MSLRSFLATAAMLATLPMAAGQVNGTEMDGSAQLAQAAPPLQIPEATPDNPPAAGAPPAAPAPDTASPVPVPTAPEADGAEPPASAAPGTPDTSEPLQAGPETSAPEDGDVPLDELSLGEIPIIETMELTPDIAKRALDSYIAAKLKYSESDLEQYENLQDFVDQTPEGKSFEADLKAAGFADVSDWNLAITTLGLSYGSVVDDQTSELELQISEVETDTELAQDIKDRMVKALKAMIPSENNKKVIGELMADPVYGPRLKELDIEEE